MALFGDKMRRHRSERASAVHVLLFDAVSAAAHFHMLQLLLHFVRCVRLPNLSLIRSSAVALHHRVFLPCVLLADSHPIGHMGVGDAHLSAIGKLTQLQQVTVKVSEADFSTMLGTIFTSEVLFVV